jgi:hypothetical protein
MREEYRLRVFENRVLRKIFVHKRDYVIGEWERPCNKELYAGQVADCCECGNELSVSI